MARRSAIAGLGTTYSIGVHVYDILRYMLAAEVTTVTALFDTPQGVMEETNMSIVPLRATASLGADERARERAVSRTTTS